MTETQTQYLDYEYEPSGVLARWHGGEYIELGYIAAADSTIVNDLGQHSHYKGDFVAHEVINVWDHDHDRPRIPFTAEALAEAVNEWFEESD